MGSSFQVSYPWPAGHWSGDRSPAVALSTVLLSRCHSALQVWAFRTARFQTISSVHYTDAQHTAVGQSNETNCNRTQLAQATHATDNSNTPSWAFSQAHVFWCGKTSASPTHALRPGQAKRRHFSTLPPFPPFPPSKVLLWHHEAASLEVRAVQSTCRTRRHRSLQKRGHPQQAFTTTVRRQRTRQLHQSRSPPSYLTANYTNPKAKKT